MPALSEPDARRGWSRADAAWLAFAVAVFALALTARFHEILARDLTTFAASQLDLGDPAPLPDVVKRADHRFVAWLVARNAYTLSTRPARIFDAEQCFPAEKTLALGDPAIGLGLIGVPAWLASGDPILTLNLVTLAVNLIAALAMFWLVRDWTGVPAAGIAAGLLYGFHALKAYDVVHPFAYDGAWTVLALFFARRLFEGERWRDALGLAAAIALQISQSFYPLLAGVLVGAPFAVWLAFRHGLTGRRPLQLAAVAAATLLVAWALLSPYLEGRAQQVIAEPGFQIFLPWSWIAPGGRWSLGVAIPGLVFAALVLRRERALRVHGDPRWLLLGIGVVVLYVAAGGNDGEIHLAGLEGREPPPALPNPYLALARWIPGLEVIRGPFTLSTAALIALCILAGLGAAALVRSVPFRARIAVSLALVAAVYVDVLRPRTLGFEPHVVYEAADLRPRSEALELHEALLRSGDAGPLVELPSHPAAFQVQSESILLTVYHHRPTSSCHGSFRPPAVAQAAELAARLPERGAVAQLRELGFATLVVWHEGGPVSRAMRRRLEGAAAAADPVLRRLGGNELLSAWKLVGDDP